jgi:hypothetical protein
MADSSILDHMALEHVSERVPLLVIKVAVDVKTVSGTIRHIQGMVRVIVGKESLATKGQQPLNLAEPVI